MQIGSVFLYILLVLLNKTIEKCRLTVKNKALQRFFFTLDSKPRSMLKFLIKRYRFG